MNKDAEDTTATDAAAPAVAPHVDPTPTPAEPFAAMDEPGKLADLVTITDHFETDGELAELAVDLANRAFGRVDNADSRETLRVLDARHTAALPSLLLISRALMRSAAAHERMAAANDRVRRYEDERRATRDEIERVHLDNLRLQNRVFSGHVDRLDGIADNALRFARSILANEDGVTIADVMEYARLIVRLAGETTDSAGAGE